MRYLLILFTLLCSSVFADTALIIHQGYNNVHTNVSNALTSAGHTVTFSTSEVYDVSAYDQVWDLRYSSLSTSQANTYNTFVQNGGFLYLVTENPGCCGVRNTAVANMISAMGGGSGLTIGGAAGSTSNTITQVNLTYMTDLAGSTISFAAGSAITNYGNGEWLLKDASGKVGGVMWIGNAGDLAQGYTGTVVTVADINWIDGTYMTSVNYTALQDIISGIVAGTVEGTISESGNSGGPETTTTTGTSLGPTSTQSTAKSAAGIRRDSYQDNGIYIDQAGSNNTISILQDSSNNQLRGIDQQRAKMWGDNNIFDIRQGAPTSVGINLIELMVDGNQNNIKLYQDRLDDGSQDTSAYGDHIIRANIDGASNTVSVIQRNNTTYAEGHFVELDVIGNSNIINFKQISDYGKDIFANITGNSNSLTILQNDNSRHFADITLTGDGHSVNLTQSGTGAHQATIDLTYGSASSTLNLNQLGSTNQSYSIEQTCYTVGGCSATLTQQ